MDDASQGSQAGGAGHFREVFAAFLKLGADLFRRPDRSPRLVERRCWVDDGQYAQLVGFTLFAAWRAPALVVVLWCLAASVATTMLP